MNKHLLRINEINARLASLDKEIDTADVQRIAAITAEVAQLTQERTREEEAYRTDARQGFATGAKQTTTNAADEANEIAERARTLKQGRALVIGGLDMLSINHQSDSMNPTFGQVSSLVDLVGITNLDGGETFKQAYAKGFGIAGYTAEGTDYTESEPAYDYATISKSKITAYTEVSEEFEKLPPAMYLAEVKKNLSVSLRRKLALEILKGDGATDHLTGIFSAANAKAIETAKDTAISAIDEHTLDTIIYAYGGAEDFADGVLILSKADLKVFETVRGADKKKVYLVDKKNHTIDGIPYVINSNITPLASATAGAYVMAYGSLSNYKLVSFSPVEISKSTDYKFKQGQIAYKASGFFGGNVVSWNGFLRIKKAGA